MVFQVQPSNKRNKSIGRRQKQGLTFAAHRDALVAATSEGDPEEPPETANGAAGDALTPSASSNKTADGNWRSNRALKSAKKADAKAIAESKLKEANSRVKQVEHEQYLDKKANRAHALKTEEEHTLALDKLSAQFYEELEAAE